MGLRYDALGKSLRTPDPRRVRYRERGSTARLLLLATVCFMLAAQTTAIVKAQPVDDWVGKRVVQKTSRFELRTDGDGFRSFFKRPERPRIPRPAELPELPSRVTSLPHQVPDHLKDDQKPTKLTDVPTFYVVHERDGGWLFLTPEHGAVAGWVQAAEVVPVEKAIEFFAEEIRVKPKDAFSFAMRGMLREDKTEPNAALG